MDGAAIARLLASPHRPTRDRAVRALSAWLSSSAASVSDAELLRAWKGLFYCVWHSDGAAAQSALASHLAALLPALPPSLSARFLSAGLSTLCREWPGIDLLRLDKFYLLLRRLLRHAFILLRNNSWSHDLCAQFMGILSEKALLPADNHVAQGISYHISDIFLDELRDLLPLSVKTLEIVLGPFITVLEKSQDKMLVNKVKGNVFDRLLENGAKLLGVLSSGDEVEAGGEMDKFGKVTLLMGLSKTFFESASARDTVQGNRKVLFGLHETFLKIEKDLEKSTLEISLPQLDTWSSENGCGDVVVESSEQNDGKIGNFDVGLDEKPSKKRKKSKEALVSENAEEVEVEANMGSDGGASDEHVSDKKKKKKKKIEKAQKELDGMEERKKAKKKKKKKEKELKSVMESTDAELISAQGLADGGSVNGEVKEVDESINFDETVISNLQKQFEKVAAEAGMANGTTNLYDDQTTPIVATVPKKRKRSKSLGRQIKISSLDASGVSMIEKSGDKSIKKVRFSMKNNLVWKPHNPLPPQSLRLPPSATPRGSALKKGVLPGPIKETPPTVKKVKVKGNSVKKALKTSKAVSPAVKRLRKLQSFSV